MDKAVKQFIREQDDPDFVSRFEKWDPKKNT